MNLTAKKALESVQSSAEAIRNDETQRFPEAASAGDVFRQGDVYIELLNEVPARCVPQRKPNPQLAVGTTQGSRHVLDSLECVTLFDVPQQTVLQGPVMLLKEQRTVTHPEHGHVVLPPGVYSVTYQRAFADELRRVAD